jgi:uncharacterized protein (DUF433 family)
MSHVVSMRLRDEQLVRLKRYARTLGITPSEASALLVEEHLRETEFAFIEFRHSSVGRQAYLKGSRLTVWWVIHVAKSYFDMDPQKTADHFQKPLAWVNAALNYYRAFPEEIDLAIEDHLNANFRMLQNALPNARVFTVDLEDNE